MSNAQKLSFARKSIGFILILVDLIFFGAALTIFLGGQYGAGLAIYLVFVLPVTVGVLSVFRLINLTNKANKANIQEKGQDLATAAPPIVEAPAQSQQRRVISQSAKVDRSSRYEIGALVVYGGRVRKVLGRRKTSEGWAYDLE